MGQFGAAYLVSYLESWKVETEYEDLVTDLIILYLSPVTRTIPELVSLSRSFPTKVRVLVQLKTRSVEGLRLKVLPLKWCGILETVVPSQVLFLSFERFLE
ncbi:hypothetical protein TNCV_1867261 [Trichonephila clavipes]|nr:hypothetical protein TNCV_1867261 [Trichonephila clavipes]